MAAIESLSQELLNAIQAPNIRTMPAYLSENDSLTVSDYLQSHYAATYRIDVSNVHWGGDVNSGHLFDIFSSFLPHKDSVKTRLDLIKFVTDNYRRYSWDCDLYLRMNNLTLNDWVEKMTYWGNCGDALSAYALCDMIGIHCCILTRSKPWTTVSSTYRGTEMDVLKLCQIRLVYLGNDRFGRLFPKGSTHQTSYVAPNFNDPAMIQDPMRLQEIETAETLLQLQALPVTSTRTTLAVTATVRPQQEMPIEADAMDKIVGSYETAHTGKVMLYDAMDSIIAKESTDVLQINVIPLTLNVETTSTSKDINTNPIPVITDSNELNVETPRIKSCHVCVKPLEKILFGDNDEPDHDPSSDLPTGAHFTRSRSKKNPARVSRIPRKASEGKQYEEEADSVNEPPKKKRMKIMRNAPGPSTARVTAQKIKSSHPIRRLPPLPPKNSHTMKETSDELNVPPPPKPLPANITDDTVPLRTKGTFKTESHTLRKTHVTRTYMCRMCTFKCTSARDLTLHHQEKHGIIYCKICNKAFNNPHSLLRHGYSHKEKRFKCTTCEESFNFNSELVTHQLTHQRRSKHLCAYPKCGRLFKNKSDLSRHAKEHLTVSLKCPDCTYITKSKRNFDSHRFQHSKIERFFCSVCNKGFVFNTQKIRHMKTCGKLE